jgi:hypothetical protein
MGNRCAPAAQEGAETLPKWFTRKQNNPATPNGVERIAGLPSSRAGVALINQAADIA